MKKLWMRVKMVFFCLLAVWTLLLTALTGAMYFGIHLSAELTVRDAVLGDDRFLIAVGATVLVFFLFAVKRWRDESLAISLLGHVAPKVEKPAANAVETKSTPSPELASDNVAGDKTFSGS